jgi:hypothetical protein
VCPDGAGPGCFGFAFGLGVGAGAGVAGVLSVAFVVAAWVVDGGFELVVLGGGFVRLPVEPPALRSATAIRVTIAVRSAITTARLRWSARIARNLLGDVPARRGVITAASGVVTAVSGDTSAA